MLFLIFFWHALNGPLLLLTRDITSLAKWIWRNSQPYLSYKSSCKAYAKLNHVAVKKCAKVDATKKMGESWLNRDPYSGLLQYNWVGFHPVYTLHNQGVFWLMSVMKFLWMGIMHHVWQNFCSSTRIGSPMFHPKKNPQSGFRVMNPSFH